MPRSYRSCRRSARREGLNSCRPQVREGDKCAKTLDDARKMKRRRGASPKVLVEFDRLPRRCGRTRTGGRDGEDTAGRADAVLQLQPECGRAGRRDVRPRAAGPLRNTPGEEVAALNRANGVAPFVSPGAPPLRRGSFPSMRSWTCRSAW